MKILVIQGSPDAESYSHQLASAYADEARVAGHDVRMIDLATEDFDPAILKGFLDRTLTPGFAYRYIGAKSQGLLEGKTAALIVTSRAPSFIYRLFGGPISRWKQMILGFAGIRLTKTLMLGRIEQDVDTPSYRAAFVEKVRAYARG